MLLNLFLLPLLASLLTFFLIKDRRVVFILSLIPLAMMLWAPFLGQDFNYPWLETLSIHFHLHVDSLSLIFLYLINAIIPIVILSEEQKPDRPNLFYGLILFLQALLIGFFTAQDIVIFTFFFEAMLLPLYFLISGWGSERAAFKFIIYMIAGSTLMIGALFAIFMQSSTFDLKELAKTAETLAYAQVIAFIFLLAFSVKTPLFPFHGWLADAYTEGPLSASILLSAILSKAGIFGILRISMGLFPNTFIQWYPYLITLAIIGVLYGAFAAWGQTDFKRLIAYSSFSHVNFVLAGLFIWNQMAQSGAILQAVNHSVTITGLFLVAGWLETRLNSSRIGEVSGLANNLPHLCWVTLFFVLSSVALPGLNNFVSEVMLLYGVFQNSMLLAGLLGLTVIFSVIYMLRWIHSVYFESENQLQLQDIRTKEFLIALPIMASILWLGLYPKPVLEQVVLAANQYKGSKEKSV